MAHLEVSHLEAIAEARVCRAFRAFEQAVMDDDPAQLELEATSWDLARHYGEHGIEVLANLYAHSCSPALRRLGELAFCRPTQGAR